MPVIVKCRRCGEESDQFDAFESGWRWFKGNGYCPSCSIVWSMTFLLERSTDKDRIKLLHELAQPYCADICGCGRIDPEKRCQCENDE